MPFKFFCIPVTCPEVAEKSLNQFLAQHAVTGVRSELVNSGQESFWACMITDTTGNLPRGVSSGGGKIDYKEVLEPADFAIFAQMRVLRKALAERDGVPPYGVFNDKQLHALLEMRPTAVAQIKSLSGLASGRAEKYGPEFIRLLQTLPTPTTTEP